MKAYTVNETTLEIEELEIEMQANTTYSFFGSILIDELEGLNQHMIYADANALSEGKNAYFIGEQLVLGKSLIIGKEEFTDLDVSIPKEDLESLIKKDVNEFYKAVLKELSTTDLNLYRTFLVEKKGESIPLNTEWVLYTFNIADDSTKEYFLAELQKTLNAKENVEAFMQKMATLAINAAG